jgi:hypothetical protein
MLLISYKLNTGEFAECKNFISLQPALLISQPEYNADEAVR